MTKDRHSEETLDELRIGKLKILQAKNGYRFSLDPVLLCAFARVGKGARVADLGTGSGVIPLILARRTEAVEIVGIERQAEPAERARRSVALNDLEERIRILEGDVREIGRFFAPQSFDLVLSNPPFRAPGSGRLAPADERAAARHELAGGLEDFLRAAAWLLPPGGRLYIIYLAERLAQLLEGMRRAGLEPKRLRCVHGRLGEPARMVLVEGRRGGRPGLALEAPLLVFSGEDYSDEVRGLYDADESGADD
ncbi:tRNA1(Val) (adenine(37)-N6)-methyltransferase [Geoalkalibacter sp.]|uniref:tRNA1(Val) (adenine(37)-N6)-methyltransferase n=1 Tax=Geoalkalibacter sp. TaxID=3041440 RepID=UPI00272E130C|nr:tRNA1(Val) (adenine(37)-N6)-methyltransferase [Geoalkalibacter sp.]